VPLAEHEHLAGAEQAFGHVRGLAGQRGRKPPYHCHVPGLIRAELVGGEQPFRHVDDGCLGEAGNGGIDGLARGLGEVERAADPGRGLA